MRDRAILTRFKTFFKNQAFWVVLTAIGLYWLTDAAIGTEPTRNSVDIGVLFVSGYLTLRLLPHAWEKFLLGGTQNDWRFLMGNVLFWAGIFAQRTWALAFRWADRPEWMSVSPWNGFFQFWILGAAILCITASTEALDTIPQTKVYYVVVVGIAGVFVGLILGRIMGLLV